MPSTVSPRKPLPTTRIRSVCAGVAGMIGVSRLRLPLPRKSHEEADEYCRALGKRLPTTYEWQYAAQGNSTRRYPWGDVIDTRRFPKREKPDGSRNISWTGPAPVDAFFDKVTVNTDNADQRAARLKLLSRIVSTMNQVADFSKVEG